MTLSRLAAIALVAVLVYLYARSPIDLLPDRLGPFGVVDDLIVVVLALWWLRRERRERAGHDGSAGASGPTRGARRRAAAEQGGAQQREREEGERGWDPYRVLGVARGASRDEIARAYREQLKLYHPDRVAELGEELQRLAHRKAIELRRAYDELAGRPR